MKNLTRLIAASMALLPPAAGAEAPAPADRPLPAFAKAAAEDIVFEIDPRIELLAGVQSRTQWVATERGPIAHNAYFEELRSLFGKASDLAAVRESEALARRGFTYDAPPAMVLALEGGEAFRAPGEGWSDYLKNRAGGGASLERFRASLAEAYGAVDFRSFLEARAADYRRWIDAASEGFEAARISAWLEDFYGPRVRPMYHFVLAPAMFPAGGYGFSREIGEGADRRLHAYQIVRAQGAPDGEPGFPSGKDLASLALHEFGHAFVNPVLEKARIDAGLKRIFEPVEKKMAAMAYGQASSFYNELIIRAASIMGERDLGLITASGAEGRIRTEELAGFYPIRRVIGLLEEYRDGRAEHPGFDGFGPVLLSRLSRDSAAILEEGRRLPPWGSWNASLGPAASFKAGFDEPTDDAALRELSISVGAMIQGAEGGPSLVSIDRTTPPSGASLRLDADALTSSFLCAKRPISVKPGKLTARFKARGEGIRKEGSQYGGSYVGFIVYGADGKRTFAVRLFSGSFDWKGFEASATIDPKLVSSIDFTVFLNESGALWIDDIEVSYR